MKEVLNGMLLPLNDKWVILPNLCIYEVFLLQPLESNPQLPSWILGFLKFQNEKTPILALTELMWKTKIDITKKSKIVILKKPNNNFKTNYIGFLVSYIPNLIQIESSHLKFSNSLEEPFKYMEIFLNDKISYIPDIYSLFEWYENQKIF